MPSSKNKKRRRKRRQKQLRRWSTYSVFLLIIIVAAGYLLTGGDLNKLQELLQLQELSDPTKEVKYGEMEDFLPSQSLGDRLIQHDYYSISYASKNQNAEWVAYELTASRVRRENARRRHGFSSDPAFEGGPQDDDFTNSGYDRGHLVPADDMDFSADAMEQTFFMTNVSPQKPGFNRGLWKKLENHVRKWATAHQKIYVVTGPILRKRITSRTPTIGEGIEVPHSFYKVLLDYSDPDRKGIAFIMPNKGSDADLDKFAVPIRKVEEETGINFFPNLSKAESDALEGHFDYSKWETD